MILRDGVSRQQVERFEIKSPANPLEKSTFAFLLHSKNNISPGCFQLFVEYFQQLRFLLEITVEKKHQIPSGVVQTRHHGFMVSKVPRKVEDSDSAVLAVKRDGNFDR